MKKFLDSSPDFVVMVTTASDCLERGHGALSVLCFSVAAVLVFQCVKGVHRTIKAKRKRKRP